MDPVGEPFVNWSRTVTSRPTEWHRPTSEDQVVRLVHRAAEAGRHVKVVGAGHSFGAVAAPDDIAVSLDGWTGVGFADATSGAVTVRAGTRLRDLTAALAARALALPIVGSIAEQSVAGAIATGTHGSSLVHGNLSSLVQGLRLVTGTGDVLDLGPGDERLEGARVHLGALGVVSEVTLRVEPAFHLVQTMERVPVGAIASRLADLGGSAEYVKVWWLPHTPDALVIRHERTKELPRRSPVRFERWVDERLMHRRVLPLVFGAHSRRPGLVPPWNRFAVATLVRGRRVGPGPLMLSTPVPVRHDETEAAIPLPLAGEAWERAVRLIGEAGLSVNFIVELRYVRGDDGWLSPAHGGDVVQLGAYTGVVPHRDRYFTAFWRAMRPLRARPHWGKTMDHTADEIAQAYPMAARFAALRDELDPSRVFTNPFLRRTLGS